MLAELSSAFHKSGSFPNGPVDQEEEDQENREHDSRDDLPGMGDRALLHDKYRMHLRLLFFSKWPRMYEPTVKCLLELAAEKHSLDPVVFSDIFQEALTKAHVSVQDEDCLDNFARNGSLTLGLVDVRSFMQHSQLLFTKQRALEGQKGLYGILGRHAVKLAPLYALHGHLFVRLVAVTDLGISGKGNLSVCFGNYSLDYC